MRISLVIFFVTLCNLSQAQFFKKVPNGFEFYSDSALTARLGTETYDKCWCKPVYKKDSTLLFYQGNKSQIGNYSVSKNNLWGTIDAKGNQVIPYQFEGPIERRKSGHYLSFSNFKDSIDYLHYQLGTKISRLDSTLKVDTTFYVMDDYKDSYLVSVNRIDFGIITGDFKVLLPLKYESITFRMLNFRFNPSGLLPLENELEKCGVVNHLGKTVVSFNYDWMNDYVYNENFIMVQSGKNKGYVNKSNQIVVPLRYEKIPYQLTGRDLVADENYTWYVNEKFVAISPKYQALEKEGNLIFFKQNYKWGVMDMEMKIIIPNVYSQIEYGPRLKTDSEFRCYYAVKNGKYGLISLTNQIIIPFDYECLCNVSYYSPDNYYIEFKKAGTLYRFDQTGKLIEKVVGEGKACFCEMTE